MVLKYTLQKRKWHRETFQLTRKAARPRVLPATVWEMALLVGRNIVQDYLLQLEEVESRKCGSLLREESFEATRLLMNDKSRRFVTIRLGQLPEKWVSPTKALMDFFQCRAVRKKMQTVLRSLRCSPSFDDGCLLVMGQSRGFGDLWRFKWHSSVTSNCFI